MRTFEITSLIVSNNVSSKTHPFTSHPSLGVRMWWYMTNTNINKKIMTDLKVTSNKSKRTFTLRFYENGKCCSKYRTQQLSKDEFQDMEFNTEKDWKYFLSRENYYYSV